MKNNNAPKRKPKESTQEKKIPWGKQSWVEGIGKEKTLGEENSWKEDFRKRKF